jgi:hypothetical protein
MFFKKKAPEPPPIANEQQYVAWFIEYSEKVTFIRDLYKNNLDEFVIACTKGATKVLNEYPSGDTLFERIVELSETYNTQMNSLVEKRGGLAFCPPELQGAVVSLLMNICVGIEFLEWKYKYRKAIDLFSIGDGTPSKNDLIKSLAKERIKTDPSFYSRGYSESMIDSLGTILLMGAPEATIVTIVETYALSQQSGASEEAILNHIENYRSQIGAGSMPVPLNLETYIKYRIEIEHSHGAPISEQFISRDIAIARNHYGC